MSGRRWLQIGGAIGVVAIIAGVVAFAPLSLWATELVTWIRGAGIVGVLAFAGVYVGAALLLLPASVLTAGAGLAYGPWLGILLVSPVSVLAATLAFIVGRTVARPFVDRRVGNDPRIKAIDTAIGRNGLKVVLLLRLSPIFPFNVLNYALSLTRVRLRDYVLGSFIGMLPGTFLYVYIGSALANVTALSDRAASETTTAERVFYWVGLAATLAVTIYLTRLARRALKEAMDPP